MSSSTSPRRSATRRSAWRPSRPASTSTPRSPWPRPSPTRGRSSMPPTARGVRLGCAPDTFLGGGLQTARDVLDAGSIGEPLGAHAAVLHLGPERWHPDPEIFFARGGGPLLDVGPYYVAALVNLLGPIAAVEAFGGGQRRGARHRQRAACRHPVRRRGAHVRRGQLPLRVGRGRLVPRVVRRRREHLAAPRGPRDRGIACDGRPQHVRGRGQAPPHGRRCLGGRAAPCRWPVGPRRGPRGHDRGHRRGPPASRVGNASRTTCWTCCLRQKPPPRAVPTRSPRRRTGRRRSRPGRPRSWSSLPPRARPASGGSRSTPGPRP